MFYESVSLSQMIGNIYFHPSFFQWNKKLLIFYRSENYGDIWNDSNVKTNDLELWYCKVFRYKCFCKKFYFGYYNLFIRKD